MKTTNQIVQEKLLEILFPGYEPPKPKMWQPMTTDEIVNLLNKDLGVIDEIK